MPKSVKILLAIAISLISIAAIFFFSDQPGIVSHDSSRKVAEKTAEFIFKMSPTSYYDADDINTVSRALDYPIRKIAHLFIYFMLGLILYLGLRLVLEKKNRPWYALGVIVLVFIIASADEINQLYSEGRGASFGDVMLDTVGGTLGLYFFHIVKDFLTRIRKLFH